MTTFAFGFSAVPFSMSTSTSCSGWGEVERPLVDMVVDMDQVKAAIALRQTQVSQAANSHTGL